MPISTARLTVAGVVYVVEVDTETNEILRRFRVPNDQQPVKTRRRSELRERIEEWFMFKAFVDEAALPAHGENAGAIATGRTQQEALYQAARDAYIDWLNA
ncbi:MAG: hypothetical protein AB7N24_17310 [Dehalococcoidia bacterium]